MAVFVENASAGWKKAFQEFEDLSGFEFMYQEDIDSGETTPEEAWSDNIRWLEGMLADAINISTPCEVA